MTQVQDASTASKVATSRSAAPASAPLVGAVTAGTEEQRAPSENEGVKQRGEAFAKSLLIRLDALITDIEQTLGGPERFESDYFYNYLAEISMEIPTLKNPFSHDEHTALLAHLLYGEKLATADPGLADSAFGEAFRVGGVLLESLVHRGSTGAGYLLFAAAIAANRANRTAKKARKKARKAAASQEPAP
jgi:hypothetical protein